jgi:hypothetical protein
VKTLGEVPFLHPNPFNPTTTISFNLSEDAVVTLKTYNVLGQESTTLIDHESMDGGAQDIVFNGSILASGVYFYRIEVRGVTKNGTESPTFMNVRKIVLVK